MRKEGFGRDSHHHRTISGAIREAIEALPSDEARFDQLMTELAEFKANIEREMQRSSEHFFTFSVDEPRLIQNLLGLIEDFPDYYDLTSLRTTTLETIEQQLTFFESKKQNVAEFTRHIKGGNRKRKSDSTQNQALMKKRREEDPMLKLPARDVSFSQELCLESTLSFFTELSRYNVTSSYASVPLTHDQIQQHSVTQLLSHAVDRVDIQDHLHKGFVEKLFHSIELPWGSLSLMSILAAMVNANQFDSSVATLHALLANFSSILYDDDHFCRQLAQFECPRSNVPCVTGAFDAEEANLVYQLSVSTQGGVGVLSRFPRLFYLAPASVKRLALAELYEDADGFDCILANPQFLKEGERFSPVLFNDIIYVTDFLPQLERLHPGKGLALAIINGATPPQKVNILKQLAMTREGLSFLMKYPDLIISKLSDSEPLIFSKQWLTRLSYSDQDNAFFSRFYFNGALKAGYVECLMQYLGAADWENVADLLRPFFRSEEGALLFAEIFDQMPRRTEVITGICHLSTIDRAHHFLASSLFKGPLKHRFQQQLLERIKTTNDEETIALLRPLSVTEESAQFFVELYDQLPQRDEVFLSVCHFDFLEAMLTTCSFDVLIEPWFCQHKRSDEFQYLLTTHSGLLQEAFFDSIGMPGGTREGHQASLNRRIQLLVKYPDLLNCFEPEVMHGARYNEVLSVADVMLSRGELGHYKKQAQLMELIKQSKAQARAERRVRAPTPPVPRIFQPPSADQEGGSHYPRSSSPEY